MTLGTPTTPANSTDHRQSMAAAGALNETLIGGPRRAGFFGLQQWCIRIAGRGASRLASRPCPTLFFRRPEAFSGEVCDGGPAGSLRQSCPSFFLIFR